MDFTVDLCQQGAREGGRTLAKGVFLPSKCLLESPFLEPVLRTLLRTLSNYKVYCKTPSKNPSLNLSKAVYRTLLGRRVVDDPLSVHPIQDGGRGFSLAKEVSAESSVAPKKTRKYPRILEPAVHAPLRARQRFFLKIQGKKKHIEA